MTHSVTADERGGARLVAQQRQVAEDGGWLEDVEAGAIGAALDQAAAQDVQGIGGRALLEDHLAGSGVDLLERGGESGTVHRCELGEGRNSRELGGGFGDGLAGAVGNRASCPDHRRDHRALNSAAARVGVQGGLAAVCRAAPGHGRRGSDRRPGRPPTWRSAGSDCPTPPSSRRSCAARARATAGGRPAGPGFTRRHPGPSRARRCSRRDRHT